MFKLQLGFAVDLHQDDFKLYGDSVFTNFTMVLIYIYFYLQIYQQMYT